MKLRKPWKVLSLVVVLTISTASTSTCSILNLPQEGVITLNSQSRFQTITGWEVTAWTGQLDGEDTRKSPPPFVNISEPLRHYKDKVSDLAVKDLGINRVRLELQCGAENPVDYYGLFLRGQLSYQDLRLNRYKAINDDDDPFHIDPKGFHFSMLDTTIEQVVLPLKQRLEAQRESLFVNVCVVCFNSEKSPHNTNAEEYGELVLAVYQHMQSKYGFVPDSWEVMLEPDNKTGWTPTHMGQSVVAAGRRLQSAKFTPRFVVPSTTLAANAPGWFDQIVTVPGALTLISELSYHRYQGTDDDTLKQIGQRAAQHKIGTAMLEWIGASYNELHLDLKLAGNSAWSQYALAGLKTDDSADKGTAYYQVNPPNYEPVLNSRAKFLRQYFKFIRRGAVRIDAATSNATFDPVAFINPNGKYAVVVKANSAGSFTVNGLPAGTYGVKHTTANQFDVDAADVTITSGQSLPAKIPQPGVLTIYTK